MMRKPLIIMSFLLFTLCEAKSQSAEKQQAQLLHEQYADQLIGFAKKLIGIPYRYATSNPDIGFDCSGFVSYVFKNIGFKVPRSSSEFVTTGKPVALQDAKVGDVLIFTGSNPKVRKIGHVGIIYSIDGDEIHFIHASSGKANGVTITPLNTYYKSRFIKAVTII
jgi:lipoprotein Spr